jgi:hypothetical protein
MTVQASGASAPIIFSQHIEFAEYDESPELAQFLDTIKENLDDKIGSPIFRPLWKTIFKGVEVESWKEEEDGVYRLTLNSTIKAARPDKEGETFIFEKEILIEFGDRRIIFPTVLEYKNSGKDLDVNNKNLNAIWAEKHKFGSLYTGVGYSTRWDTKTETFISDNINDAGWMFQSMATPRTKTMQESVTDWNDRGREEV